MVRPRSDWSECYTIKGCGYGRADWSECYTTKGCGYGKTKVRLVRMLYY